MIPGAIGETQVCPCCMGEPIYTHKFLILGVEFGGIDRVCEYCRGRGLACAFCGLPECDHCNTGKTAMEIINEDSR